jgi:hypothetical protein
MDHVRTIRNVYQVASVGRAIRCQLQAFVLEPMSPQIAEALAKLQFMQYLDGELRDFTGDQVKRSKENTMSRK